uniref:Xylulose kinase n=1 Tax=Bacillus licheniformis TaxID=1402 RepID=P70929_BACLI|nr:Xylulokinase [Bacillus licheniformis]
MEYVIGVDLGTSTVKIILVNQRGELCGEVSKPFSIIEPHSGYSEQDPAEWADKTKEAIKELVGHFPGKASQIKGVSFSGQMHGLVLLNGKGEVLRNAILWNDTRTTEQCRLINDKIGKERLLEIAKNPALEGFTLPKLLWVKEYEKELFEKAAVFLLPKDYVRYTMTGRLHSEYSDAAGTLLLDVRHQTWSGEICRKLGIPESLCPDLIEPGACVGGLRPEFAAETGLSPEVKVFAGADNACGRVAILKEGTALCSIGTSGLFSHMNQTVYKSLWQYSFLNHAAPMLLFVGVTLSAGRIHWYKMYLRHAFAIITDIAIAWAGLLLPLLSGERTPHADADIASFIGMDSAHTRADFVRAVIEGITFSLHESIEQSAAGGKDISRVISIGGGAKSNQWLQIQADIFNADIIRLTSEQGPAYGAAMIAASGAAGFRRLRLVQTDSFSSKKPFRPAVNTADNTKLSFKFTEMSTGTRKR